MEKERKKKVWTEKHFLMQKIINVCGSLPSGVTEVETHCSLEDKNHTITLGILSVEYRRGIWLFS